MIRGIIEWFKPNDEVRFRTYLKRVAKQDQDLADDLRESIPSTIQLAYTTFTFDEIMDMKTKRVESLINKSHDMVNGVLGDVKKQQTELSMDKIIAEAGNNNVVVNTNCKLFWGDP